MTQGSGLLPPDPSPEEEADWLASLEADEDEQYLDVLRAPDGNTYDPDLRDAVASAIKRFPNTEAECWIGPEVVLGAVEEFLLAEALKQRGKR